MTARNFSELCFVIASILTTLCAFCAGYWIGKNKRNDKNEGSEEE
jgi:hypothetical protein